MGKAKPANHTSVSFAASLFRCGPPSGTSLTRRLFTLVQAELKKKAHDATINRGGGQAGLQDRKGGAVGHAKCVGHPAVQIRYGKCRLVQWVKYIDNCEVLTLLLTPFDRLDHFLQI